MNLPMAPWQKTRVEPQPKSLPSEALGTPETVIVAQGEGAASAGAAKLPFFGAAAANEGVDDVAEQAASEELVDRVTVSLVRREQRKRWRRLQKRVLILLVVSGLVGGGVWASRKYSGQLKKIIPFEFFEKLAEKINPKPIAPNRDAPNQGAPIQDDQTADGEL